MTAAGIASTALALRRENKPGSQLARIKLAARLMWVLRKTVFHY
ncbi:hypothetical protein [Polaromonas sp. CG9_12]|nr:hypothetical protein [Polaromonas sp. CG9_12]